MNDRIENFIRALMSARGTLSLYSDKHLEYKESLEKAHRLISDILNEVDEVVIGIVGDEFVYQNEIFTNLSMHLKDVTAFLTDIGIERMVFYPGVEKEELGAFIQYIMPGREYNEEEMFEYFTQNRIRNIAAGRIKAGGIGGEKNDMIDLSAAIDILPKTIEQVYENSLDVVTNSIENVLDKGMLDTRNLKTTIASVMTNLLGEHQEFLKLSTVKRYDVMTFMHILKVSILSMHFSSQLGFENEDILDIGLAALFHDIGKIYISRKVIKKPDKLTKREFDLIASHTHIGAEIMLNYVDSLGILPVIVAFEHHVKYDGRGYPKLKPYHKLHIASQITSLCDVYDALSERRSYKDNFSPDMVYAIMKKGRGEHFNPNLFDKFFETVGVWPIGAIVELSDKRIAIVRDINPDDIEAPIVQITGSDEKIDLKSTNGTLAIKRSLNPQTDGKIYLRYI
jgi:putative nucleotidyltransferase with HDIG domain